MFRVGFYQFRPLFGRPETNFKKIAGHLEGASADLIVLPELPFTGYLFRDRRELMKLSEEPDLAGAEWQMQYSDVLEVRIKNAAGLVATENISLAAGGTFEVGGVTVLGIGIGDDTVQAAYSRARIVERPDELTNAMVDGVRSALRKSIAMAGGDTWWAHESLLYDDPTLRRANA